jgi:c-di-GMP-binding flagellar brake protein YcgR
MGMEQRRAKRLHHTMPVFVAPIGEDQSIGQEEEGVLYDLSAGGCGFYLEREIPIGERVHVRIILGELLARRFMKPELTARGAVCRIERHDTRFLMGVRFLK